MSGSPVESLTQAIGVRVWLCCRRGQRPAITEMRYGDIAAADPGSRFVPTRNGRPAGHKGEGSVSGENVYFTDTRAPANRSSTP